MAGRAKWVQQQGRLVISRVGADVAGCAKWVQQRGWLVGGGLIVAAVVVLLVGLGGADLLPSWSVVWGWLGRWWKVLLSGLLFAGGVLAWRCSRVSKTSVDTVPAGRDGDESGRESPTKTKWDKGREWLQAVGSVGTGVAAVAALWLSINSLHATQGSYDLTRRGQISDRFNKAVAQLGDNSLDIRLGGVYALGTIALQSSDDTDTVRNVLAAFVRTRSSKPSDARCAGPNSPQFTAPAEDEDVAAALTLLADPLPLPYIGVGEDAPLRRPSPAEFDANAAWKHSPTNATALNRTCLWLAQLRGGRMSYFQFDGSDLREADMSQSDLRHVEFSNSTNIDGADFAYSDLSNANFPLVFRHGDCLAPPRYPDQISFLATNLAQSNLRIAGLTGDIFVNADLSGAMLDDTSFADSIMEGTKFVGTIFNGPVDFRGTYLSGVDLSQIKLDKKSLSRFAPSEGALSAYLNFAGAGMDRTNLEGIDLSKIDSGAAMADFSGTDLRGARLGNNGKMDGIRYDDATQWPPGFHKPPPNTFPLRHADTPDFRCTAPH
jgi:uncharacterized protein YjbI with pentapeptide repeats